MKRWLEVSEFFEKISQQEEAALRADVEAALVREVLALGQLFRALGRVPAVVPVEVEGGSVAVSVEVEAHRADDAADDLGWEAFALVLAAVRCIDARR